MTANEATNIRKNADKGELRTAVVKKYMCAKNSQTPGFVVDFLIITLKTLSKAVKDISILVAVTANKNIVL